MLITQVASQIGKNTGRLEIASIQTKSIYALRTYYVQSTKQIRS
ncbi:hypothetical protein NUACC26_047740 [Scytonema sp. NUACC26]